MGCTLQHLVVNRSRLGFSGWEQQVHVPDSGPVVCESLRLVLCVWFGANS